MPDVSFEGLLIVCAIAFAIPFALGLAPGVRVPSVVLEIVAGIVVGPAVLGWVEPDVVIEVIAVVGLAFLLFLAGLEVDVERIRGRALRASGAGFVVSITLAILLALLLTGLGLIEQPLFVAVTLLATGLGLVIPVLKDAGEASTDFGQLAIAGSSVADFGAVILLTLLFSAEATATSTKLFLLVGFVLVLVAVGIALAELANVPRLNAVLERLQDTTAEIRVRGAVALLMGALVLAETLGLEAILGAFLIGAVIKLIDKDRMMTHPYFHSKLQAVGFGFFIPVFFVSSGLTFDLRALTEESSALMLVPIFLVGLLIVRGLPALLYGPLVGRRRTLAAGLLQATSLPFIVAATQIGIEIGALGRSVGAALVAAGLVSVLVFPALALTVLRGSGERMKLTPARPTKVGST